MVSVDVHIVIVTAVVIVIVGSVDGPVLFFLLYSFLNRNSRPGLDVCLSQQLTKVAYGFTYIHLCSKTGQVL